GSLPSVSTVMVLVVAAPDRVAGERVTLAHEGAPDTVSVTSPSAPPWRSSVSVVSNAEPRTRSAEASARAMVIDGVGVGSPGPPHDASEMASSAAATRARAPAGRRGTSDIGPPVAYCRHARGACRQQR